LDKSDGFSKPKHRTNPSSCLRHFRDYLNSCSSRRRLSVVNQRAPLNGDTERMAVHTGATASTTERDGRIDASLEEIQAPTFRKGATNEIGLYRMRPVPRSSPYKAPSGAVTYRMPDLSSITGVAVIPLGTGRFPEALPLNRCSRGRRRTEEAIYGAFGGR
jgi:hypothetical protein